MTIPDALVNDMDEWPIL